VKLIEGRTDTTEEEGEGCDGLEVGGRCLSDCEYFGSRAATTCRPTLLLEALLLMLSGGFGDSSGEGLCWQQRAGVVGGANSEYKAPATRRQSLGKRVDDFLGS
jgi:hypothetical protein